MENLSDLNFDKLFNDKMTSEEAIHMYAKLLKTVPDDQKDALERAYSAVANKISAREYEEVKKYGVM